MEYKREFVLLFPCSKVVGIADPASARSPRTSISCVCFYLFIICMCIFLTHLCRFFSLLLFFFFSQTISSIVVHLDYKLDKTHCLRIADICFHHLQRSTTTTTISNSVFYIWSCEKRKQHSLSIRFSFACCTQRDFETITLITTWHLQRASTES